MMDKYIPSKKQSKELGVVILISDKGEFRAKKFRVNYGHFLMSSESFHQKEIKILNIHLLNDRTSNL